MSMKKIALAVGSALIVAVATQATATETRRCDGNNERSCTSVKGCTWTPASVTGASKQRGSCSGKASTIGSRNSAHVQM